MQWRRLTAVVAVVLTGSSMPARADYQEAKEILESGTLGGTRGLRVRRIGSGSASFSQNGSFEAYPASTAKIIQHAYAMTRVQGGSWTLGGTTTDICAVDDDTPDNCGTLLNAVAGCGAIATPLDDTLSAMMKNSSNSATNAVQERVGTSSFPSIPPWSLDMAGSGRLVLNGFVGSLGMTGTAVNHKFGCEGFCGNPTPNTFTLVDFERLYTAIATSLYTPALRVQLKDLMLNESGSFLDDIIDQEAADTGKNAWKEDFRDLFYQIYKAGSWTCSGKTFRTRAGLIQLPTYNGAHKRLYTYGVFAHDSESEFYLDGTEGNASKELLRLPIRAALLTWGFGYQAGTDAGGVADTLEHLPTGTPAGSSIFQAVAALRGAEGALANEPRDYVAAFAHLRQAVDHLTTARRLEPRLVPARLIKRLLDVAERAALDVEAYVSMTSLATIQEEAIADMERSIGRGRSLARRRNFGGAIRQYEAAAQRGNPLINWQDRGTSGGNPDVGFIGPTAKCEPTRTCDE